MLQIISDKLEELKLLDTDFKIFGAESHRYTFNLKIEEEEILVFENEHKIKLPENYRTFLKTFGNGGCGPDSGLFKLEKGIYDIPFNAPKSEIINLKKDFKFDDFWNLETYPKEDYDKWMDEYDDVKWANGMLRIGHLGCGMYSNLIISGKEKGTIWIDSRTNEGGIYPANYYNNNTKNDFLSWYLYWIENAIIELKNT